MSQDAQRRAGDRLAVPFFLAGITFMGAAVGIYVLVPTTPAWLVVALAVLGASLLPTDRVLRLVRIWRKNGDRPSGSTPVPP